MPSNKPEQTLILEFFTSINSKRGMAKVCAIDLEIQGGFLFPQWTIYLSRQDLPALDTLAGRDSAVFSRQRTASSSKDWSNSAIRFLAKKRKENRADLIRIAFKITVGVVVAKSVEAY